MMKDTSPSTEKFTEMLKRAIKDISKIENKNMGDIEKEISRRMGKSDYYITTYLKRGNTPSNNDDLETLAFELLRRGKKDEEWLEDFSFHGGHLYTGTFVDRIFPPKPTIQIKEKISNIAESSPTTIVNVDYGALSKIFIILVAALLFFVIPVTIYNFWNVISPQTNTPIAVTIIHTTEPATMPSLTPITIASPTIVPSENLLKNPSFETPNDTRPWTWRDDDCSYFPYENSEMSYDGVQYLATGKTGSDKCKAFYQDLDIKPSVGETYHFAIWVRSENEFLKEGRVSIQAGEEHAEQPFSTQRTKWQCVETELTITNEGHEKLRAEIYMDKVVNGGYYFDNAIFQRSDETVCPPTKPLDESNLLENHSFDDYEGNNHFPWVWRISECNLALYEDGSAWDGKKYLATNRNNSDKCESFFQDIVNVKAKIGETYYFAMMIRSPRGVTRKGRISIRASGAEPSDDEIKQKVFSTDSTRWECIETVLTITKPGNHQLFAEIHLDSKEEIDYNFDKAIFRKSDKSICDPKIDDNLLKNASFEGGHNDSAHWDWVDSHCNYQIYKDSNIAYDGDHYVATNKNNNPACRSFLQDIVKPVSIGETYHFRIWVRSSDGSVRKGRTFIWVFGEQADNHHEFTVYDTEWQCIETALTVRKNSDGIRTEVYLDSEDDIDYYFDDAVLVETDDNLCPIGEPLPPYEIDLQIQKHSIQSTGHFLGNTISIQSVISHTYDKLPPNYIIGYYISETFNGEPIGGVWKKEISPIDFVETSDLLYKDLYTPMELKIGETYFVIFETDVENDVIETNKNNNKESLQFKIAECDTSVMYCDVPPNDPYRLEIEAWRDKISNGCRSATNENIYNTAVFCPEMMVNRRDMAVFAMKGKWGWDAYDSLHECQDYFADIPDTLWHCNWISTAKDLGLMEGCGTNEEGQPIFCPDYDTSWWDGFVTRKDLVLILANIAEWDLNESTTGDVFIDVTGDSRWERAAEYMYAHGFIDDMSECKYSSSYEGNHFCGDDYVNRGVVAMFMSRALAMLK